MLKFTHLEVEQAFRFEKKGKLYYKRPGKRAYGEHPTHGIPLFLGKIETSVIPEGEPPSVIEAARRDARWHVLKDADMQISTEAVKNLRMRDGCGLVEARKILHKRMLMAALDTLRLELDMGTDRDDIVHDLTEIVREVIG